MHYMKNFNCSLFLVALMATSLIFVASCKKDPDDVVVDPIASFQFQVGTTNFLEVTFTNFSQNATKYAWDFGDGKTSTAKDPVHLYDAVGTYTVKLTASNDANVSRSFSTTIDVKDPDDALALLAGTDSKRWKLFREGSSMGVGPDAAGARIWWSLSNDGKRPCVYQHEFTFHRNGDFVFNDNGIFWGEAAVFSGTGNNETCFPAQASNMVNKDGANVSAWLGGTHKYSYNTTTGKITLTGTGAWMGLPQLGTVAESVVPEASKTFSATIEKKAGYDLLTVSYQYADLYWDFTYVSYGNWATEPALVTVNVPCCDLDNITPTAMFNTFASTGPADVALLVPTASEVTLTVGADDPAGGITKVGRYVRGTTQFSDLKFQLVNDVNFDNFTQVSIDVYVPSTNTYSAGGLTQAIQLWIADASEDTEFWLTWEQYDANPADIVVDQWKTYTWPLGGALTRDDLDLVGLVIGGSNHNVDGTFFVRNLRFH